MVRSLLRRHSDMVNVAEDSAGWQLMRDLYWLPLEYWCEPCKELVSVYFA
jgi:hypothetical protein